MQYFDIIVAAVLLLSFVIGYVRGFVRESFSLLAWMLAFLLSGNLAEYLAPYIPINLANIPHGKLAYGLAFLVCFVLLMFIFGIITNLIKEVVYSVHLGSVDRKLGVCFGLLRGFIILFILIFVGKIFALQENDWWHRSFSANYLEKSLMIVEANVFPNLQHNLGFFELEMTDNPNVKINGKIKPEPEQKQNSEQLTKLDLIDKAKKLLQGNKKTDDE